MPQPRVHSPGEGREALWQKVLNLSFKIRYGLTVHIIRLLKIFTGKIFNFSKLSHQVKFQRITQILRNSPTQSANYTKFAHFVKISYLCFRHLPRQRTLQNSSELRKFHAIRPHSSRMTRNSHHLFTLYITFQMPDQWQGTP